jgi:acetyl esterase/lipase
MIKKKILFLLLSTHTIFMSQAQREIPLYNSTIPNSRPAPDREKADSSGNVKRPGYYMLSLVSHPTLTLFLPPSDKANGSAIVICPGGGYSHLAMAHEGMEVARRLNEMGIAAFVLKYRLPSDETMIDKEIGPLQDAQRAIQLVRQHAADWGVDPKRVGIMGFSAGGHLASTAGTHFTRSLIENKEGISLRPDWMILGYPVISFSDSIGHRGSRDNLLGKHPAPAKILEYSNELQVTPNTPPTFLVHAGDDKTVPVANSLRFYEALVHSGVPSEMHVYPHGGHGFGLHNPTTRDEWMDRLTNWMDANGWLRR